MNDFLAGILIGILLIPAGLGFPKFLKMLRGFLNKLEKIRDKDD